MKYLLCVAVSLLLVSCQIGVSSSSSSSSSGNVNEIRTLKALSSHSYDLKAGTYTAEITASGNDLSVEWIGSDARCDFLVAETRDYKETCTLIGEGELVITDLRNSEEDVTVKITKH